MARSRRTARAQRTTHAELLGTDVLELAYVNAGTSAQPWEHEFKRGAELWANDDGSLTIRKPGTRLHATRAFAEGGRIHRARFLENPPMKKRSSRRGRPRASTKHSSRKTKRPPPKGFRSWSTFMASIRPGSKKRKRARTNAPTRRKVSTMAKRKRSGGRRRRRPASAPRRSYRRRRSNPPNFMRVMRTAPAFAGRTALNAGVAIGGKIVARKGRGLLKQAPGTLAGSVLEASIGLVGGLAISAFGFPGIGEAFALGGVMAPMETGIQQAGIKHISDSLGDDGYYVGGDSGIGLISAYPDDYSGVVGDEDDGVAGYVSGAGSPLVEQYLRTQRATAAA